MIDVDTLLATPLEHDWTPKRKAPASAPDTALATRPNAAKDAAFGAMLAVLGDANDHDGQRWHMCGCIGGVMRRAQYTRQDCAAFIRSWLADVPGCDIDHGVTWACGAWDRPAAEVSGTDALAAYLPDAATFEAAAASYRTLRKGARAEVETSWAHPAEVDDTAADMVLDTTRQGTPRPTQDNCAIVIEHVLGDRVRYDATRGRILVLGVDPHLGYMPDGLWTDIHTTATVRVMDQMGLHVTPAMTDRAIALHARERSYNPLEDDLLQWAAVWDGTPRVDAALVAYWGAPDVAATRAASRVFLLSMAARGMSPGEKVDTCLVFIGKQGTFKSTSLEVLAGGPDRFSSSPLPMGDKDAMQVIRGKWLWELSELANMLKRDREVTKAFLSERVDTFRASYGRHTEDVPRATLFCGSSNDVEILSDPTGARRFMPVCAGFIDLDALRRDRTQILGEAARRVLGGEQWWPTEVEKGALAEAAGEHQEHDTWEDAIAAWLAKRSGPFTLGDVFDEYTGAIKTPVAHVGKPQQMRAAAIMRRMGLERVREPAGQRRWLWSR